uniref:F-box domain-containing protein n=2 Tax=Caenorhabditis tropicalis TaxID=1561998 RepID=A0A1I7TKZ1_9PELO
MTFPLLKLPRVAYNEVLFNYSVPDLVEFSLLSSRCHRIIRSIRFPFTGLGVTLSAPENYCLQFLNGEKVVTRWIFKPGKRMMYLGYQVREINGIKIGIEKTSELISSLNPPFKMKIACDYVLNLFRLPITHYSLHFDDQKELFPKQFGVTKCDTFSLKTTKTFPIEEMDYVLEKVKVSKSLVLDVEINYSFECYFLKFSMDDLKICKAFWITRDTFLLMDCARIELEYNHSLPLDKFVSQWLSSRYTRFEWLKMSWNGEEYDWNEEFETMEWNPKVRGRYFRIRDNKLDCEEGIDFLRDDGLLATVVRHHGWIHFVVWHKRFEAEAD